MKVGFVPVGPLRGALGFGVVSTLVFSTVAFAERWMYQNLTVPGAYGVWMVMFLVLAPIAFIGVVPSDRRRTFPLWFNAAFFGYCVLWCAGWFLSPNTLGEVVGCIAGSIALAGVLVWRGYVGKSLPVAGVVLAICNLIGYFAGGYLNAKLGGPAGMLTWGLLFGSGTGAGIGAILISNTKEAQATA
jgi:hypothetical protein